MVFERVAVVFWELSNMVRETCITSSNVFELEIMIWRKTIKLFVFLTTGWADTFNISICTLLFTVNRRNFFLYINEDVVTFPTKSNVEPFLKFQSVSKLKIN